MITHSDSITKLMTALLAVQGEVEGVPKDSKGNRSTYASLEAVMDVLRGPCQGAGLVLIQAPGECIDSTLAISTMIVHAESGEWLKSTLQLPVAKPDPQMAGSAITYARRYSLLALFCLPAVDDDGEAAQRPATRPQPPVQQHTNINAPAPNATFAAPVASAIARLKEKQTPDGLLAWFRLAKPKMDGWSKADVTAVMEEYDAHMQRLQEQMRAG